MRFCLIAHLVFNALILCTVGMMVLQYLMFDAWAALLAMLIFVAAALGALQILGVVTMARRMRRLDRGTVEYVLAPEDKAERGRRTRLALDAVEAEEEDRQAQLQRVYAEKPARSVYRLLAWALDCLGLAFAVLVFTNTIGAAFRGSPATDPAETWWAGLAALPVMLATVLSAQWLHRVTHVRACLPYSSHDLWFGRRNG